MLFWQKQLLYAQSPNIYLALFYKAQIIIWHYFTKSKYLFGTILQMPNINIWQLFHKAQMLFWQLFRKAQMLFWHIFTKSNIILTLILHMLKSLTHGKYNYSSLKKYFFHKTHGSYAYFPIIN